MRDCPEGDIILDRVVRNRNFTDLYIVIRGGADIEGCRFDGCIVALHGGADGGDIRLCDCQFEDCKLVGRVWSVLFPGLRR
jgi:hypothetical protein